MSIIFYKTETDNNPIILQFNTLNINCSKFIKTYNDKIVLQCTWSEFLKSNNINDYSFFKVENDSTYNVNLHTLTNSYTITNGISKIPLSANEMTPTKLIITFN